MLFATTILMLYVSFFLFFRAYQIGVQKRFDLITDWHRVQLPNPDTHQAAYIRLYLIAGVVFLMMTLCFIILNVPFANWWPLGFAILFAASYRNYLSRRARGESRPAYQASQDNLETFAKYPIGLLALLLIGFFLIFIVGIVLLIRGNGDRVWMLILNGALGVALGVKVILIKYDRNNQNKNH